MTAASGSFAVLAAPSPSQWCQALLSWARTTLSSSLAQQCLLTPTLSSSSALLAFSATVAAARKYSSRTIPLVALQRLRIPSSAVPSTLTLMLPQLQMAAKVPSRQLSPVKAVRNGTLSLARTANRVCSVSSRLAVLTARARALFSRCVCVCVCVYPVAVYPCN